ncbi:MAG TPA: hydroxymethylbilane synthase [Mycobacteriales bacterium]|nr:hydroxymethylbilane synthase [Mycobacteriales bacterium]
MTAVGSRTLRIGTRRSALALAQTGGVAQVLRAAGHQVELIEVETEGDRSRAAVEQMGSTGVFVTELRQRLLAGDVDVAVHSFKDLPTQPPKGIVLAAVPPRADPRDALVSRAGLDLAQLPAGARVGTGSPRRAAQLRALGFGLEVEPIRGNVDTRLRRVADGDFDAVVVAAAGLARLGRLDEVSEILDPGQMLPAPAQGALAVECRSDDSELVGAVSEALDDPVTRSAVAAERALLATLEAGCSAPVGALADVSEADDGTDEIYLRAVVVSLDGERSIRLSVTGPATEAQELGNRLAADLLAAGAAELMANHPKVNSTEMIGDPT